MEKSKFIFCRSTAHGYYQVYLRENDTFLGRVYRDSAFNRWTAADHYENDHGEDFMTRNEAAEQLWEVSSTCLRRQLDKANARIWQLEQELIMASAIPPLFPISQIPLGLGDKINLK